MHFKRKKKKKKMDFFFLTPSSFLRSFVHNNKIGGGIPQSIGQLTRLELL
jgi:hypothetical protein